MRSIARLTRRRFVCTAWGLVPALSLAGCTDASPGDGTPTPTTSEDGTGAEVADQTASTDGAGPTDDSTADESTGTGELDLREANVVDVAVARRSDGIRFDVTLHHDDDGEDGYADWWQVERLDGTRLGRRTLAHAHTSDPFTRSATVEIPDDVTCVVVRGHDQTHGYGGQALIVTLESGTVRTVRAGTEPTDLQNADCP